MTCNCNDNYGCGGACDPCSSNTAIKQAVDDALASKKETLEGYVDGAAASEAAAAGSAIDAARSASAAAQSQTNAETAASTATQLASSVTNSVTVIEKTLERVEDAQSLLEENIWAIQTKPVYFEVTTPTTSLVLPETELVFNVRSIYISSGRKDVGYGFTFDKESRTVTLVKEITAEDIANAEDGFVLVTVICDVYSSDDPTSFPLILASNVGANNVGTSTGETVETRLESLDAISGPTGLNKIGAVSSFSDLQAIVPETEGQVINLRSHQAGWAAEAKAPEGGGIFIARQGTATDDGGYICVPTGSTTWYWERWLRPDEYLTPQMYGYVTGYNFDTETGMELKPYIQAAIDKSIEINKAIVFLPEADYYTSEGNFELAGTGHNRALGVKVQGLKGSHTSGGTRIFYNAPSTTTPLFSSTSPSSLRTMHGIDDLWLEAVASNLYQGYALKLTGTCFMVSERVHVERMYDGIHLLNTRSLSTDGDAGDENGYCEFDAFRDWTINKCYHNVSFNNDGTGDASMHGVAFVNMFSQLKEDGDGIYFNGTNGGLLWYNSPENSIKFWGGAATGVNTCQLLRVEGTEVRGVGGGMTWEGFGRISCDINSYFRFDGNIFGLPGNKALIDYSGVVGENSLSDARVIFNNTTSRDRINMSNTIMSPYFFRPIMSISRSAKNNTNYAVAMPIRITTSATEKPTTNEEYEGLAFPTNHNGDVWFGEVVSQSNWFGMIPTLKYGSSSGNFTNYTAGITWNIKNATGVDAGANAGWVMDSNLYPLTTLSASLGTTSNRLNAIYANGGQITTSGIFPRTTAAYDLGSSTTAWNNIFSQNAVTVISDSNLKPVQESLTDAEISVASACSKLFIKYKLAAAINEKGEKSARYHFGVIAQSIISAFKAGGLSADDYGVVTTAEQSQEVSQTDAGYSPVEDANGEIHIAANDDGVIDIIDTMDVINTDDAGVITLTRTTHLIRYEELLCFINAGIVARLETLEAKIS
jgi:hypothetical protein